MTLPYKWRPAGTQRFRTGRPNVGDLMPFEHAVYRVVRAVTTEATPADDRVHHLRVVPVEYEPTGDPVVDRNAERAFVGRKRTLWDVYPDEHYPMCGSCREPMPCRERMAAKVAEREAAEVERHSMAGVCPSCHEPVTARQESVTWEDNVIVLGGPPVTFHLRAKCYGSAVEYEKRWAAAEDGRRMRFTCGDYRLINHGGGTYSCSSPEGWCPGPHAAHTVLTTCDCPDHWPGQHGHCQPDADAVRVP